MQNSKNLFVFFNSTLDACICTSTQGKALGRPTHQPVINIAAFVGDCRAVKSFLKTCAILQQFVDLIAGAGEEEEEKLVLQGTADFLLWLCHLSEWQINHILCAPSSCN